MSERASLTPAYFEAIYAADIDPWQFETSEYERAKYADTIATLADRRFASGFEVGCSIGVLTELLAARCDRLLAIDVAEAALDRARDRCRDAAQVRFARMRVPGEWPDGQFDLIVFSEVLYYLSPSDIAAATAAAMDALVPGGLVLLVHFTDPTNYPVSGDEAVGLFVLAAADAIVPVRRERRQRYRLDCFERT